MTTDTDTERVMLDIETLGTTPGAAVVAVGAAKFTVDQLNRSTPPGKTPYEIIEDTYERTISISSCEEAGLTLDGDTVEWWLSQDDEAQATIIGGDELESVLTDFSEWLEGVDEIWGNDPAFDCVLLSAAYDAVGVEKPWDYSQRRCYRTIKELGEKPSIDQTGTKHSAVDDAVYQARVAAELLCQLQK